jgi:ribulose kinase
MSIVGVHWHDPLQLEMETPKVLWLKHNMEPELFCRCQFFDLPDYLTYKATNNGARSACSVTCKCAFVPDAGGWQPDLLGEIGLGPDVIDMDRQMGAEVLPAGHPIKSGLSKQAAEELGLIAGTPVGSGLIDA